MNKDNSFFIVVILFYYYIRYLSAIKNLFQSDLWIAFSEHVFLQFQFSMLNGRDGNAIDVADGAIAETESRKDTQTDVVFLHHGVLFSYFGETIVVDGIERSFYLTPFVQTKGDD